MNPKCTFRDGEDLCAASLFVAVRSLNNRRGMPLSTFLMQVSLVVFYIWLDFDPERTHPTNEASCSLRALDLATCALGVVSLCGFYVVGSVSEVANIYVHESGAVGGFVGLAVYFALVLLRLYTARDRIQLSTCSLAVKVVSLAYLIIGVTGAGVLVDINTFSKVHTTSAFFEWTCGIAIGTFLSSLAVEVLIDARVGPLDPLEASINDDDVRAPLLA